MQIVSYVDTIFMSYQSLFSGEKKKRKKYFIMLSAEDFYPAC